MIQLCGVTKELESIDCVYEKDKPFDFFTIKFMARYRGYTVGNCWWRTLVIKNPSLTGVLSTNYCLSLLVQGGLKIPCQVEIYMPPTVRNKQLIDIYRNSADHTTKTLYYFFVVQPKVRRTKASQINS